MQCCARALQVEGYHITSFTQLCWLFMTINFINMEKLCALTIVWYVKGAQNMLFRPGSLPGARAGMPSKARGVWEYLCTYLAIGVRHFARARVPQPRRFLYATGSRNIYITPYIKPVAQTEPPDMATPAILP